MPFPFQQAANAADHPSLRGLQLAASIASQVAHTTMALVDMAKQGEKAAKNAQGLSQLKLLGTHELITLQSQPDRQPNTNDSLQKLRSAQSVKPAPHPPILEPLDDGYPDIVFQYDPDDLVINGDQRYGEGGGFGQTRPFIQWTGGAPETISFTAVFHYDPASATQPGAFASSPVDMYRAVSAVGDGALFNRALGRPPLWTFSWGDINFGRYVLVVSQGALREMQVLYKDPLSLSSGTVKLPRDYKLSIMLRAYRPFDYEKTNPNEFQHDTIYVVAHGGEQWEHMALRIYGDAALGESLRRRFPGIRVPVSGQVYKLPDYEKVAGSTYAPTALPIRDTDASLNMRDALMEYHSRQRFVAGFREVA